MINKIPTYNAQLKDVDNNQIGEVRGEIHEDLTSLNFSINIYDTNKLDKEKIKESVCEFINDFKEEIKSTNFDFLLK